MKVVDGQYICGYNLTLLHIDYPSVEFPVDFLREDNPELPDYNVQICRQLPQPPIDSLIQNIIEKDPELVDNEWVQDWIIVEKSPEEKRLARYKPIDFLLALQSNQNCINWSLTLNPILYGNFLLAVNRAIDDDNWIYVQAIYDELKAMSPHEHGTEFTELATYFGVPLAL